MSKVVQEKGASAVEVDPRFTTISGRRIAPLYAPADTRELDYARDLADPGQYPYTRGIHESMYRGRVWTMRQFAGFGSAAQTNARFKYLLEHGGGGLSVAFDLPTLMGRDPDHPLSLGEVGKCGVAVSSLAGHGDALRRDPARQGHHLDDDQLPGRRCCSPSTSGGRAGRGRAGDARGHAAERHPEGVHRPEGVHLPAAAEHADRGRHDRATAPKHMPKWNTISISGYHIREAGATAAQELAFTLRDGIELRAGVRRRGARRRTSFAPRLSFFFNSHNDFFEEIAKFRAARRIWARIMRERFGARTRARGCCASTRRRPACSLTAQQPYNNVVRVGAAGARRRCSAARKSLHTNSLDETLALPTEEAVTIALRTQQIIAARVRRGEHDRPARRLVARREADERARGRGARVLPPHRRDGRHGGGGRARLPAARDPGVGVPLPAGGGAQGEGRSSASTST